MLTLRQYDSFLQGYISDLQYGWVPKWAFPHSAYLSCLVYFSSPRHVCTNESDSWSWKLGWIQRWPRWPASHRLQPRRWAGLPAFLGCSCLPGTERNVQSAAHGASGNMLLIQQECGSIHRVYSTVAFEVQPQNFVAVKMVVIYRKMSLGCLLYKSFLQLSLNINQNLSRQQNDGFGITFSRPKEKG